MFIYLCIYIQIGQHDPHSRRHNDGLTQPSWCSPSGSEILDGLDRRKIWVDIE